jgi:type IV secretion system protein VirB10
MPVKEIGDPRLQALFGASDPRDAGVRPTIRLPSKGLSPVAIAIFVVAFALILFAVLNARRTIQSEPTVRATPDSNVTSWEAPPLYIPPVQAPLTNPELIERQKPAPPLIAPAPALATRTLPPQVVYAPQPLPQPAPPFAPGPQPRVSSGAPLVIDTGNPPGPGSTSGGLGSALGQPGDVLTRMRASALANRSMTVPQGYLIPAVLETGFDSTNPGFARAVVSRDVRGFDGRNVLIPRGSRLIGEYRSETAQGQKRAVISWTRLLRPDGMTIGLDSPAVDTLGRGGVPASVNTHFLARFGDALLQTTVGIGSTLAGRAITGPVVVLPGNATGAVGQSVSSGNYAPTLTVRAGKSISVFVAHDLDFSAAGAGR